MKRMFYRKCLFTSICVFIFLGHIKSQTWISCNDNNFNECFTAEILHSDEQSYRVRITINGFYDDIINDNDSNYHKITFPKELSLQNIGEPSLPVITQLIGLPDNTTATATIVENCWKDMIVGRIWPKQPEVFGENDSRIIQKSDVIYNDSVFEPAILSIGDKKFWKGIGNVYLSLCPFKYYPRTGKLSILSDFIVEVRFNYRADNESYIKTFKEEDLKVFDNKDFLCLSSENKNRTSNVQTDYLIIVGDIPNVINSDAMDRFRRWKAFKGLCTDVVSTTTIGSDSASIKNYINQQIANGVEYVLLVGDHTKIPIPEFATRVQQKDHYTLLSDYWYGCVGGYNDVQADIPIGRFLCSNINDFINQVDKTINYEKNQNNWNNKVLLISNMQRDSIVDYQAILENIRNNTTYNHSMSYYTAYGALVADGGDEATPQDIFDYVNSGMNLVTYNGHAFPDHFWLRHFVNVFYSDTCWINYDKAPVFVSTGCYAGRFVHPNSMMYSYMRSTHTTTSYVGGTVPVFTNPANNYLLRFYDKLLNDYEYHIGPLNLKSHLMYLNNSSYIDNAFCTVVGGDPSLEIWTGSQSSINEVTLHSSGNSIVISTGNTSDYKVHVVSTNGQLLNKYVANGSTCSIPMPTNSCYIVLDKHDYIPYIIFVDTENNYIQDEDICTAVYYLGTPMSIGYDVTNSIPYGNVSIEPGANVIIEKGSGVLIKNGFECKNGAEFVIQ